MSKDWQGKKTEDISISTDDASVFEAVADAAEDLDLELNPKSRLDKRMVGIFAAAAAHSSDGDSNQSSMAAPATNDNDEIEKALKGWAETHPEDMLTNYGDYTTEPYVAVMPGGVKAVTRDYLSSWIGGDEYNALLAQWSPQRERSSTMSNVQIVHISEFVANATFQCREIGEGDVPVVANAAAIVIKDDSGQGKTTWKIAAVTKYGAFE